MYALLILEGEERGSRVTRASMMHRYLHRQLNYCRRYYYYYITVITIKLTHLVDVMWCLKVYSARLICIVAGVAAAGMAVLIEITDEQAAAVQ